MESNKLRIGIVGHGFVGKAVDWGFNRNVEKFIVDPILSTKVEDLKIFKPDVVFICVPTPMSKQGSQDNSILKKVCFELNEAVPKAIKVIKSTVLPGILKDLSTSESKTIYNPEFLREKHAYEDFENSEMIIFGGEKLTCKAVSKIYLKHSKCKTRKHYFTDIESAALIKYSINTFLASKVVFFNELYDIFSQLDTKDSWEDIINIISVDKRMGESHMSVPGHDGKRGFGGACFPKDCLALVKYAESIDAPTDILEAVIKKNNKIRSQYDKLDSREIEQNVSFDDNI